MDSVQDGDISCANTEKQHESMQIEDDDINELQVNDYNDNNYTGDPYARISPRRIIRNSHNTITFGDNYINDMRNSFDSSFMFDEQNDKALKQISKQEDSFNQINIPK